MKQAASTVLGSCGIRPSLAVVASTVLGSRGIRPSLAVVASTVLGSRGIRPSLAVAASTVLGSRGIRTSLSVTLSAFLIALQIALHPSARILLTGNLAFHLRYLERIQNLCKKRTWRQRKEGDQILTAQ